MANKRNKTRSGGGWSRLWGTPEAEEDGVVDEDAPPRAREPSSVHDLPQLPGDAATPDTPGVGELGGASYPPLWARLGAPEEAPAPDAAGDHPPDLGQPEAGPGAGMAAPTPGLGESPTNGERSLPSPPTVPEPSALPVPFSAQAATLDAAKSADPRESTVTGTRVVRVELLHSSVLSPDEPEIQPVSLRSILVAFPETLLHPSMLPLVGVVVAVVGALLVLRTIPSASERTFLLYSLTLGPWPWTLALFGAAVVLAGVIVERRLQLGHDPLLNMIQAVASAGAIAGPSLLIYLSVLPNATFQPALVVATLVVLSAVCPLAARRFRLMAGWRRGGMGLRRYAKFVAATFAPVLLLLCYRAYLLRVYLDPSRDMEQRLTNPISCNEPGPACTESLVQLGDQAARAHAAYFRIHGGRAPMTGNYLQAFARWLNSRPPLARSLTCESALRDPQAVEESIRVALAQRNVWQLLQPSDAERRSFDQLLRTGGVDEGSPFRAADAALARLAMGEDNPMPQGPRQLIAQLAGPVLQRGGNVVSFRDPQAFAPQVGDPPLYGGCPTNRASGSDGTVWSACPLVYLDRVEGKLAPRALGCVWQALPSNGWPLYFACFGAEDARANFVDRLQQEWSMNLERSGEWRVSDSRPPLFVVKEDSQMPGTAKNQPCVRLERVDH